MGHAAAAGRADAVADLITSDQEKPRNRVLWCVIHTLQGDEKGVGYDLLNLVGRYSACDVASNALTWSSYRQRNVDSCVGVRNCLRSSGLLSSGARRPLCVVTPAFRYIPTSAGAPRMRPHDLFVTEGVTSRHGKSEGWPGRCHSDSRRTVSSNGGSRGRLSVGGHSVSCHVIVVLVPGTPEYLMQARAAQFL